MESRFILFINRTDADEYTNPFDTGYAAYNIAMGVNLPIWSKGNITLIWDAVNDNYTDECLETIKQQLIGLCSDDCRIGVALHNNVRLGEDDAQNLVELQKKIVNDALGGNKLIIPEEYHKGENGVQPYCLFCDALLNDDAVKVKQAIKDLDAFFFKPKIHDKALELLTEWLPDYLGRTVPGNHDKSKQLWEDFKRKVELVDHGTNDSMANEPLFREIEALVAEVKEAGGYDIFAEKYDSLYHNLGAFIER